MRSPEPETGTCSLCEREVPRSLITLHHLRPRQNGSTARHRTPLCRPCHKQLHAVYSNKTLAHSLHSSDQLKSAPELQPFLGWIRKQKSIPSFRTVISEAHPERARPKRR
jgi:hypothetical protein